MWVHARLALLRLRSTLKNSDSDALKFTDRPESMWANLMGGAKKPRKIEDHHTIFNAHRLGYCRVELVRCET